MTTLLIAAFVMIGSSLLTDLAFTHDWHKRRNEIMIAVLIVKYGAMFVFE